MLIEKITSRINSWTSKYLSYAGRLQLVQSMFFNIQNYWCKHFILPKGVLKAIDQKCLRFFWNGRDESAKGARVSWSSVCYPKSEGGLGLKDITNWNKACIIQNIWSIFTKVGSLWIAWIEAYVLEGMSIWLLPISIGCSWNWRKIMQLTELASNFIERRNGGEVWKYPGSKYQVAMIWEDIKPKQEKRIGIG